MSSFAFRTFGLAVVSGLLSVVVQADLHFDNRVNDYSIGFDDLNFTNGSFDGTATTTCRPDAQGDVFVGADFGLPTGTTLTSWTGDANIAIQNLQDLGTHATADVFATTGAQGLMKIRFGGNTPGGPGDFYGVYDLGGQHVFEVNASSAGFVDDHGTYIWGLAMPGDWSGVGTAAGQHQLLSINPSWTVIRDFVYDAGLNQTFFGAINRDYLNDGQHNVDVSMRLYGNVVPEPLSMVTIGVGIVAFLKRRRSASSD